MKREQIVPQCDGCILITEIEGTPVCEKYYYPSKQWEGKGWFRKHKCSMKRLSGPHRIPDDL